MLESSSSGQQAITPAMVRKFARTACERIRLQGGGYRRDHLTPGARQRVEVADKEALTMGSKSTCCGRWPLRQAQSRVRPAFAVLF